ncbi:hypothetical protein WAI453_000101 [Rhynchosporium graminicola]
MNRSDVQAASLSPCQPSNDDTFGPIVKDCRSGFDFNAVVRADHPVDWPRVATPPLRPSTHRHAFEIQRQNAILVVSILEISCLSFADWSPTRLARALVYKSHLEDRRAVPPSLLLSIYLLASLIFDIAQVRTLYLRHETSTLLGLSTTSVVLKAVLLVLESRSKRRYLRAPYNGYSPETTGGIFNRSFFWWINPILATGFRRLLTLDDLFQTDASLLTDPLRNRMQNSWEKYHAAIKYVSQPSAARDENDGYGLIGAAALIYLGIAISTTQYQHAVNRLLVGFRGATASLIYSKTLKQQAGVQDKDASLTHMSSDIDQLAFGLDALCQIWAQVIELVIGLYLLSRKLGWVCVAPIVIVVISTFCVGHVTKLIGPRQGAWIAAVQTRVGMTSAMLGSMKSVKMMGLSNTLMDTLQIQRVMELNLSKKFRVMGMWRMIISFLPTTVGPMATFLIFAIKASVNGSERLSTSQTFSSLSIITLLTSPAEEFLQTLPMIGMATGCLARIETYLLSKSCEDGRLIQGRASTAVARDTEDGLELQHLDCSDGVGLSVRNASIKPSLSSPDHCSQY